MLYVCQLYLKILKSLGITNNMKKKSTGCFTNLIGKDSPWISGIPAYPNHNLC